MRLIRPIRLFPVLSLLLAAAPALAQPSPLLTPLADPNLALLALFFGILGIYAEANLPGTILPGALGLLLVLLALFELAHQPLHPASIAMVVLGLLLLILEVKFFTRGILALIGIAALIRGTLTLVDSPDKALHIRPTEAILLSIAFGVITVLLSRLALRARRGKFRLGVAALTGLPATAMEPINLPGQEPVGRILVAGEIWQATSTYPIKKDAKLRVLGGDQYQLQVEQMPIDSDQDTSRPLKMG